MVALPAGSQGAGNQTRQKRLYLPYTAAILERYALMSSRLPDLDTRGWYFVAFARQPYRWGSDE
jgi:hypothetical protein